MTGSPTVYVYAIVRCGERPDLAEAPPGPPDASAPRAEPAGDELWLVVSDVVGSGWQSAEIDRRLQDLSWVSDRALAHERVVEHLAQRLPVVPMKLFTLFTSVERAVASLAGREERLLDLFDRIAGHAEWGVRVHLERERARRRAKEAMASPGRPSSGRDFLLRKKRLRDAGADVEAPARERIGELAGELSAIAAATVLKPGGEASPTSAGEGGTFLLFDAAYLVSDDEGERFEEAVHRGARDLDRYACQVTLTGPWPPYHFVEEEAGA